MTCEQDALPMHDTINQFSSEYLTTFHDVIQVVGTTLDLNVLMSALVEQVVQLGLGLRALLLIASDNEPVLKFGAAAGMEIETCALDSLTIHAYLPQVCALISAWNDGVAVVYPNPNAELNNAAQVLADVLCTPALVAVPVKLKERLLGVLAAAWTPTQTALIRLQSVAAAAAIALENARVYSHTVQQSAASMHELFILRQIDRELNDTIEPEHVFNMTLDWALRFTNANAAAIALYDEETGTLQEMLQYGYDIQPTPLENTDGYGDIPYRVARSGRPEIIPDVSMDKDYVRRASSTRSQMCVPVLREDRVIAVITVESKRLNGFTDEHLDFIEKLAARAGVAIDNARLFSETKREREKLSNVINTTADVVIVCGLDDRIALINPAAFAAFQLDPSYDYVGLPFEMVFANTPLIEAYRRGRTSGARTTAEVALPNNRTFEFNLTPQANVGWIIVMHDITPFKEMDRLKSELIATVSHDLKQPLSVMNGYIELLLMHKKLDSTGINFVEMVRKSIQDMRRLIDDLLDLAKIESGIRLELEPVALRTVLQECVEALQSAASSKNMTITVDTPANLPAVTADRARLQQVFHNLIGNAIKYTPSNGWVRVVADEHDGCVRVVVQDNGLGISLEDQARVFDRFYRVRRPETDGIEGTGLGLAIVKSLVEAHNGRITLESKLGQGSSFTVFLPVRRSVNQLSC